MTPSPPDIPGSAAVLSSGRRNRPRLLAAGAVVLLVVLVLGYVGFGYVLAQARLSNAERAYDSAHDHQLGMFATHRALSEQVRAMDFSKATVADYQVLKATNDQIITQAKQAQRQIQTDDSALASVQKQLQQDQWLTTMSRGHLNREANRIGYMRRALADAKTMNADYAQMGTFLDAYANVVVDLLTISDKADASDFAGAAAATAQLKSDVDKATLLDKAAGLPPEGGILLRLIGSVATDYTNSLNAYANSDSSAYASANAALLADESQLSSFDYVSFVNKIDAYYALSTKHMRQTSQRPITPLPRDFRPSVWRAAIRCRSDQIRHCGPRAADKSALATA